MKIVMAANWWYRRGGLGAVMLDEASALEQIGHEIIPFAAKHPKNLPSRWEAYFPPFHETQELGSGIGLAQRARIAADLFHNTEAARNFDRLISAERPDVIHLHNTVRQLSPSILRVAERHRTPVVMTLHDYGVICPQGQMYKGEREACRAPNCNRGNVIHAVTNRCVKGSLAGSSLAAVEHLVHRAIGAYAGRAALLLAPSRFLRDAVASAGLPREKLRMLPNALADTPPMNSYPSSDGHMLYAGRLSREKGVDVLMAVARRTPAIRYVIAGDGPLRLPLAASAPPNVRFVGHQASGELAQLYADAVAVLVPSVWDENAPITVLEAMRAGRCVVATRLGGSPEMLEHGGGVLVPPADPETLADVVTLLWNDRDRAQRYGAAGRLSFEQNYRFGLHLERLLAYYHEVLN
jgi:glycosyltransferase involved in cell wall biosynthesis